jgi:hypothetical protein
MMRPKLSFSATVSLIAPVVWGDAPTASCQDVKKLVSDDVIGILCARLVHGVAGVGTAQPDER